MKRIIMGFTTEDGYTYAVSAVDPKARLVTITSVHNRCGQREDFQLPVEHWHALFCAVSQVIDMKLPARPGTG